MFLWSKMWRLQRLTIHKTCRNLAYSMPGKMDWRWLPRPKDTLLETTAVYGGERVQYNSFVMLINNLQSRILSNHPIFIAEPDVSEPCSKSFGYGEPLYQSAKQSNCFPMIVVLEALHKNDKSFEGWGSYLSPQNIIVHRVHEVEHKCYLKTSETNSRWKHTEAWRSNRIGSDRIHQAMQPR